MPKKINAEDRKRQIAEAAWNVILKGGMEAATVRNIAAAAGLSLGSLRHYFPNQEALLLYAMELVKDNFMKRVEPVLKQDLLPKERIVQILLEMVPTTEETRAEMKVWFAFTFYFSAKKKAMPDDGIYDAVKKLLFYLDQNKLFRKELEIELETDKLYALLDGIAMHAFMNPERYTGKYIKKLVSDYVNRLCKEDV